jgi:D-arginine utilization repressor
VIKAIKAMLPTATAIERLLYPHAEVVIHDIKKNRIAVIMNAFSKRRVGDPALLTEEESHMESDWIGPYEKINWDGRKLKSVSSLIRDEQGQAVAMLCINLDISDLEKVNKFISGFIGGDNMVPQPELLFKEDWQEKINQSVYTYLNQKQLTLENLRRHEKKALIEYLQKIGAFNAKNAALYVARVLKVSRATIYNYLNYE